MKLSDFACVALLNSDNGKTMLREEIYRACAAVANNGIRLPEEGALEVEEQVLLNVRRLMKLGAADEAREKLLELRMHPGILRADKEFLLGAVFHRSGAPQMAQAHYYKAAQIYCRFDDERRYLRALINSRICANDFSSYSSGPLFALEQTARRSGCHDLVGIVQKGRAGELLSLGRFREAAVEAENATQSFLLDGCPEDLAVARLTGALAKLLIGDLTGAQREIAQVSLHGGKLSPYFEAYHSLVAGRPPRFPVGHPLELTPWGPHAHTLRRNSVTGKLIRRLQQGPATADELIVETWGASAGHPSYRNRLFVLLNKIKKEHSVVFDGARYQIPS